MFKRKFRLPTTPVEFDCLVERIQNKYGFGDKNHTAAVISVAIRHLPPTQGYYTLDYFANYVRKALANYIADLKSQNLKHEAQIDQLVSILRNDPNDNQARDGLEKAQNEGSLYAKAALEKLGLQDSATALQDISAAPLQN